MFKSRKSPESYALSVRLDSFDAGVIKAAGQQLTVLFSERNSPPLCIGQKVTLRFLDGGAVHGKQAKARVTAWRDRGTHREVEFRMHAEIVTLAAAALGLRDDVRVAPNPADRIVARVRALGRTDWRRTLLKDVSLTGIGVLVNSDTDQELVETSLVEVSLGALDEEGPIEFVGKIRFRGIEGCSIRHGIEIIPKLTNGFAALEERLTKYSLKRQRELAQASRRLDREPAASASKRSA